ncbi:MAG: hypothetical protein AAGA77_14510 [Bacteroidota bacterium]
MKKIKILCIGLCMLMGLPLLTANTDSFGNFMPPEETTPVSWPDCEKPNAFLVNKKDYRLVVFKNGNSKMDYKVSGYKNDVFTTKMIKMGDGLSYEWATENLYIQAVCDENIESDTTDLDVNENICFHPNENEEPAILEFTSPKYTMLGSCLIVHFPINQYCDNPDDAYKVHIEYTDDTQISSNFIYTNGVVLENILDVNKTVKGIKSFYKSIDTNTADELTMQEEPLDFFEDLGYDFDACHSADVNEDLCNLTDYITVEEIDGEIVFQASGIDATNFNEMIGTGDVSSIYFRIEATDNHGNSFSENIPLYTDDFSDINNWSFSIFSLMGEVTIALTVNAYFEDASTFTCANPANYIVGSGVDVCPIWNLLKYNSQENGILVNFNDPDSASYLLDALNQLGIGSVSEANDIVFDQVDSIAFTLSFGNINTSFDQITVSYLVDNSSNLETLEFYFGNFDLVGFEGSLLIEYFLSGGKTRECFINPIYLDDELPLPEYDCGEAYSLPLIENLNEIPNLFSGDIIFVAGLAVKITEAEKQPTGYFTGQGYVSVPFGKRKIKVEFLDGILVNTDYEVFDGEIRGVVADPSYYPDFVADPGALIFGEEICVPPTPPAGTDAEGFDPVTGLNARGFYADGTHVSGGYYDENGFDINGIHEITNTPYNEAGCSVQSLDIDGNPCDPAQSNDPAVTAFIDSVSQVIPGITGDLLDQFIANVNTNLDTINCDQLRSELSSLIAQAGYNSDYIVGSAQEYLNEGMNENFTTRPQKVILQSNARLQIAMDVEDKHIELYDCDRQATILASYLSTLDNISVDDIMEELLDRLQNITKYQVDNFNADPQAFEAWIAFQISQILDEAGGFGHVDYLAPPLIAPAETLPNYKGYSGYNAMTSTDELPTSLYESTRSKDEVFWLFEQGEQDIMGIDRAFYLEELYSQMTAATQSITVLEKLPMQLRKEEDGVNYDIYLDNMVLSPEGASIDAYFVFTVPESGKKIVFKLLNLNFGKGGIIGESKLQLESEIEIRMNNVALLRILPGEETFVAWDCEGFTSISLAGQVELCRNIIIPLDESTLEPLPYPERYAIDFNVSLTKWTDFYMTVNEGDVRPFAIAGYDDLKWTVNHMALDFSDYESPTISNLPVGYNSVHYVNGEMEDSWRGFYLGELSVTIPSVFTQDEGNYNTIGVRDLVIDDNGVSAVAFFEGSEGSLLPLEEGNAGGWGISIDQISLVVLQNHLHGGGFGGEIQVPVLDEPLEYSAMIYAGGNMEFTVSPTDTIGMDVMLAQASLLESSYIKMIVQDGEVTAKAHLNGVLSMEESEGSFPIQVSDITFTGFEVSNKSPYLSPGDWEVAVDINADFGGFEINISDLGPVSTGNEEEVSLAFNVDLLLEGNNNLAAAGAFEVIGRLDVDDNGKQDWNFDRIKVNAFYIDATFSAGRVIGSLTRFEQDPVYGKGFQGMVSMQFNNFGDIQAVAIFGKTDHLLGEDYKFFMIDAQASLNGAGIPLGALYIDGFAGGVSYHMVQDFGDMQIAEEEPSTQLPPLGESLSGVIYTPDPTIGLGLKAGALISVLGKKAIFNGKVSFEMIFNDAENNESGGGLHSMTFEGIGQFMSKAAITGSTSGQNQSSAPVGLSSSITAHLVLSYNHTNREFLGQFKTYLYTPGGLLRGAGSNNKMVNAEIYFGPEQWYMYMGTPQDPCGIMLNIPLIGSIEKTSYLMVGTEIPNMPDLPENVREIAFTAQPAQTFRQSGAGFVYGSAFDIGAELNLGIASGSVSAGMGFDVMMRQYQNAYCLGNHPYEELGINGWYAMGQMWAFIEGEVKVFGIRVLEAGVAAVLQAQFPNPFFAQATLGIRVKIGPFVQNTSLDFAVGDYCIIVGNESSEIGLDIIANTNPTDNMEEVPADADIEVYFNIPLGQNISMPDPTSIEGEEVTYRVNTATSDDIEITSTTFGEIFDYDLAYKNNNSMLLIKMRRMFYAGDTISMTIELEILKNGSPLDTETKTITYVVGESYDIIPASNVEYSYPLDGMHNFYKEEYNQHKGFIQLKSGMPELFYEVPDGYDQRMRLTSENGEIYVFDYEYQALDNTIEFPMNPDILENETLYKLEVVRLVSGSYPDYTEATEPVTTTSTAGMMGVPLESISNKSADATDEDLDNGVMYQMYFRVSEYNTLQEKLDEGLDPSGNVSSALGMSKLLDTEHFDIYETKGLNAQESLIKFYGDYNNDWFDFYNDVIYDKNWPIEITFEIPCETDGANDEGGFNGVTFECPNLIDWRDTDGTLDIDEGIFLNKSLNENHLIDGRSFLYGVEYETTDQRGQVMYVPEQQMHYNTRRIAMAHLSEIKRDIENCLLIDQFTWFDVCLPDWSQDYPVPVSGATIEPVEMRNYLNYGSHTNSYGSGDYPATMEYVLPNGIRTSMRVITFSYNSN